jgi:hypothetical protein
MSEKPIGQVVPRSAIEPHALAVLASDDAEAVVLDLVQPRVAGWRLRSFGGQAWRDEAERQGIVPPRARMRGASNHGTPRLGSVAAGRREHVAIALAEPEEAQQRLNPLRSFTPDNIDSVRSMGHQRAPSVPFAIKNKIAD